MPSKKQKQTLLNKFIKNPSIITDPLLSSSSSQGITNLTDVKTAIEHLNLLDNSPVGSMSTPLSSMLSSESQTIDSESPKVIQSKRRPKVTVKVGKVNKKNVVKSNDEIFALDADSLLKQRKFRESVLPDITKMINERSISKSETEKKNMALKIAAVLEEAYGYKQKGNQM
jgi:hypothetical protein